MLNQDAELGWRGALGGVPGVGETQPGVAGGRRDVERGSGAVRSLAEGERDAYGLGAGHFPCATPGRGPRAVTP